MNSQWLQVLQGRSRSTPAPTMNSQWPQVLQGRSRSTLPYQHSPFFLD
jgi:hypothetical protein